MEVKPGYKQTETGVIPNDWDATPLKGKIGIAHGFPFSSEFFAGHGPWRLTTPGHFYEEGGFRDLGDKQKYYVGPVPSDYILQPGDVIVAMTEQADGLLGSTARIPVESGYLHNQRLGRFKALASDVEIDYLVYVFNSPRYRARVRETAAGTKVKHTSPEKLLEISIPLPHPTEQRAIAEALGDVDGLLQGLERLIAKKRDLKQAAMQQLLTAQTRLPGFSGEWEEKRLGDIADCFSGGTPPTEVAAYFKGDIPWITSGDLNMGYIESVDGRISKQGLENSAAKMIGVNTLLIALYGATAGVAAISRISAAINQAVLAVLPYEDDVSFLYFQLVLHKDWVISTYTQGGQPNLSSDIVKSIGLRLPPVPEQTAIATVLSDMDAESAALEQRRDKTRALKQAMMQELLTGRTRLV